MPNPELDWTVPQRWDEYTPQEHAMWDTLFARQSKMLQGRVVPEFIEGLDVLRMSKPGIPDFEKLSARLMVATGWQVVAVPGLVPDAVFFEHLANRRFVAGRFIRTQDQLDYLKEPDVFHDVFGHVPLLAQPVFADYMQAYGEGGLRAADKGVLENLARLYWYTVEFGLIKSNGDLKLYGAGIVSSFGESVFALDDPSPNRIGFDLQRVMRTKYKSYFVIDSFEQLLADTLNADFGPIYNKLQTQSDIEIDDVLAEDRIFHKGTQAHANGTSINETK
jgi:phenylalanine-4-hydroxylase